MPISQSRTWDPEFLINLPVVLQSTNYELWICWNHDLLMTSNMHDLGNYSIHPKFIAHTYLLCIGIIKCLMRFKCTYCWFSLCIHCTWPCVAWWHLHERIYCTLNVFPPVSSTLSLFLLSPISSFVPWPVSFLLSYHMCIHGFIYVVGHLGCFCKLAV